MKQKLFESVGKNKFRLINEGASSKMENVRSGLKKVFSAGHKQISYNMVENVGLGYIRDIEEAKRYALEESMGMADEFGYEPDENKAKFVKKENRYAKQNPEGPEFGSGVPGVWNDSSKVEALKKLLMDSLDAGNFDAAHKVVDQLANYHN